MSVALDERELELGPASLASEPSPFALVERWRAICACGARGPERELVDEARADADAHWRRWHRAGLGVAVVAPCMVPA